MTVVFAAKSPKRWALEVRMMETMAMTPELELMSTRRSTQRNKQSQKESLRLSNRTTRRRRVALPMLCPLKKYSHTKW